MTDETQKLLIAAVFSLAAAYFLTHLHETVAIPQGDFNGVAYTYNTVTGKVTTVCRALYCLTPKTEI
jgi:hypothetical protein